MRRLVRKVVVGCIAAMTAISWMGLPAWADDAKARRIMEKVDARDDGDNQTSQMEMILIDKHGSRRERRIQAFSRKSDFMSGCGTHVTVVSRRPCLPG